ncbi:UNVERIFIED_CONTAM: HORMA domain-containing protein 1 [Siphonaria sp. JEL0065]|nr:HORMA domain-containing protein 1 [Siphonaria sp. JEL0065]
MKLKKLKRGASVDIDFLNEWLEKGVFEALEKKYLKSIVFGVYSDSEVLSTFIESYQFTFTYPKDGRFDMVVDSTSSQFKTSTFNLKSKKESVNAMMGMLRRVIIMTQALSVRTTPFSHVFDRNAKPEEAPKISMKIFYYENVTPHDYEPPSFRKAEPEEYDNEDIKVEQFELGSVDANYHAVALQVRTAQLVDSEEEDNEELQEEQELVSNSQETQPPQDEELEFDSQKEHILVECSQSESPDDTYADPSTNETTVHRLSQISNLTNVLAALQAQELGGTPTFGVNTQERVSATPEVEDCRTQRSLVDSESFVRRSSRRITRGPEVNSQAAATMDIDVDLLLVDMAMISCTYCNTLNHPHCCGYDTATDKRIPADGHCCYSCANLIYHPTAYNLEEVANVAIFRRGLVIANKDGGIASIGAFAEKMGVSIGVAKVVVKTLCDDDFLKAVKRGKNQQQPALMFSFNTTKKRSDRYSFWMSGYSLPMAPNPELTSQTPTTTMKAVQDDDSSDNDDRATMISETQTLQPMQLAENDDASDMDESQEVLGRPISSYTHSRTPISQQHRVPNSSSAPIPSTTLKTSSQQKQQPGCQDFDNAFVELAHQDSFIGQTVEYRNSLDSQGFTKSVPLTQELLHDSAPSSIGRGASGSRKRGHQDEDPEMTQDEGGLSQMTVDVGGDGVFGGSLGGGSNSRGGGITGSSQKRAKMSIAMRSQEF